MELCTVVVTPRQLRLLLRLHLSLVTTIGLMDKLEDTGVVVLRHAATVTSQESMLGMSTVHLQDKDRIVSMVIGMEGGTETVVATGRRDRETVLPMETKGLLGSPGHMARNCPQNSQVQSNNAGQAPGIATYNIELIPDDAEALRNLAESTSATTELHLNSVEFDYSALPRLQPAWELLEPRYRADRLTGFVSIGDPSEDDFEGMFDDMPSLQSVSDSSSEPSEEPGQESDDTRSVISGPKPRQRPRTDSTSSVGGCPVPVEDDGIRVQEFDWDELKFPQTRAEGASSYALGNVFEQRAVEVLNRYRPYWDGASTEEEHEFFLVHQISHSTYAVENTASDLEFFVTAEQLNNPNLDLPNSFRQMLRAIRRPGDPDILEGASEPLGDVTARVLEQRLNEALPWPEYLRCKPAERRFQCFQLGDLVEIQDHYLALSVHIGCDLLRNPRLDFRDWYAHAARRAHHDRVAETASEVVASDDFGCDLDSLFKEQEYSELLSEQWYAQAKPYLELNAAQRGKSRPEPDDLIVQRNAAALRDLRRVIPEPIVVVVSINGHPACALLDTGSLSDFMSAKLAHQLGVKTFELAKPMPLHLAVQGSRAKINYGCTAQLEYQEISSKCYFDIINLLNYDIILGTPFFFQHRVLAGFNPVKVVVGSAKPLPVEGKQARVLESRAAEVFADRLESARQELREYAAPICMDASDSPLPPLRTINHTIPLKDESKTYSWRPSKCPDALCYLWIEKCEAYLRSGRWQMSNARNTSPMLLLTKPGTGVKGVPHRLRVVCDLHERNANTHKVTSPLPDMEAILRRVSRKPYRTLIDGKDAYEQIRVEPSHVPRTAMTTPDGNMVSLVLQQGDCNAVATYQTLMNHIFAPYLGVFMDVYLDDIAVYSDTLEEHLQHVKLVIDILRKETLYLSAMKLRFLCREMKILGRIVDDQGIRMDPEKVDNVLSRKVPTNRELLRGFLGSVGYLADDIATVRIPMGILSSLTGSETSFKWEFTHQRAFDEIKKLLHAHREHHRVPLDYSKDAARIWLVTDGSHGGIAGVVTQGEDFRHRNVAAFFSAKLSSAQMNYPVHEIEMLAGIESMRRHRDILLGCSFTWVTDHKGLIHLLKQKNLSGRQARWLERISEFDFTIEYVPGVENVLADALSRIYAHDRPGTVRAPSEYTQFDEEGDFSTVLQSFAISAPVSVDPESLMELEKPSSPLVPPATAGGRVLRPRPPRPAAEPRVASNSQPRRKGNAPAVSSSRSEGKKDLEGESATKAAPGPGETSHEKPHPKAHPNASVTAGEATTGRPETAKEFAKRIKRVVLHGPRGEQREGVQPAEQSSGLSQQPELGEYAPVPPLTAQESQFLEFLADNTEGIDLLRALQGRYSDDKFFETILANPKQFKNFLVKNELVFLRDSKRTLLCIPNVLVDGRSVRELVIRHAHSLLAHLGSHRTLSLLRDHMWWKTMVSDVQAYCDSCMTCKRSKPSNQKPYGLLNPLAVPSKPWEAVGVDFVGPLPESRNRDGTFDKITTIIDLLTGMVHLVPSRQDYKAPEVAELMFSEMLRQCIGPNQKDWVSKLPGIEFAINLARSESTGFAPFFLNTGRLPRVMVWDAAGPEEYPGVRSFAQKVKNAVMAAHDSILAARVKQTRDANRRHHPAPFELGDLVYVSTKNMSLPKGYARKLAPRYIGPYRIVQDYGNNSFKLELPANLRKQGIHAVFHSSLLRVHQPNG
ncbi:hypothetical protein GSI_07443 [Ganoderma sinense ZZ0214-1]|uniref:RNA-directed DNA polymerase n=1 Tax=Ganoderma sinense ZZ0214-1 TaxID=1077348 RepID=A0A2G8S934_9APHY|nr:hypothetical protein GSI_07443 [Ganoderma sinense ZZ0214-1]